MPLSGLISSSLKPQLSFLKELFPARGHQRIWLVGGSVRDAVSGGDIKDIDLVTTLSAAELERVGFRVVKGVTTSPIWFQNFKWFGNIEVTPVANHEDLLDDLKRRDFTLNALLMTLEGEIVDPLEGRTALESRSLEPCSSSTFSNDPIRIFRALRFEADGFFLSGSGVKLITDKDWEPLLAKIPVERFTREMLKALQGSRPDIFFRRMVELDVGRSYLPELFAMPRIPAGPLQYHPEGDLFAHSTEVLQRVALATDSALARFCGFFHDLGKLSTDPVCYPKHHGHEEAGFKTAAALCKRLALPAEYGRALAWTSRLHGNASRLGELRPSTRIKMAEQAQSAGISKILPMVSAADKSGGDISTEWGRALEVAGMNLHQLGINQDMLESMKPSQRGGYILQKRVELLKALPTS